MDDNILQDQSIKRKEYLDAILNSPSRKKLIVAGPGTGKTYTFEQLLRKNGSINNLALTFIRKLVLEMKNDFGDIAEVKTFHAYCKKLLHQKCGGVELFPFLTQVIKEDSEFLDLGLSDFNSAFQTLDEESEEVCFYINRGNYYNAVAFDDAVYRVYKEVLRDANFLSQYDQVVIDEYQDFNPLEVAFIDELQKRSPILIVGDDDQAVYRIRNSSPSHLRKLHSSGDFDLFDPPFCSRCPQVVVEATSSFVNAIIEAGGLESRIERPFVPFVEGKEYENEMYPKIITVTTSNISCVSKLIAIGIQKIPKQDITDAYEKGYPCVLIVGQRQYLNPIRKALLDTFPQVTLSQADMRPYNLIDGYELLLRQATSNLGWRILARLELTDSQLKDIIQLSQGTTLLMKLLPEKLVEKHSQVLKILGKNDLNASDTNQLNIMLGSDSEVIISHFLPSEIAEEEEPDHTQPSTVLSSFEGCKGLSAGHVFIVGLNHGVFPKIGENQEISDVEISKFIVGLTRTRKLLYLLSNRWDFAPSNTHYVPSHFLNIIPSEYKLEARYINSARAESFMKTVWREV